MSRIELVDESSWKSLARWNDAGRRYDLETRDTRGVPVRLFLTPALLAETEPGIYRQIVNATRFPGAKLVVITPDVHFGYGVPVGCVILTERDSGALAMGPVGFDIGCGMMSAKSEVSAELATPDRKLAFHREVMKRVDLGAGGRSLTVGRVSERDFQEIVRGGAEHWADKLGGAGDRARAERHRIPVDDDWDIPWGGPGSPERGLEQLGSLGGGNHFIELQRCEETGTLFVQVHTGSRGFGHGLATNYFALAKDEHPELGGDIDLGYFTPQSKHHRAYQNAVAAGGNFAIVNRLVLFEAVREAFTKVFREDLSLVYEISHNLAQAEHHPDFGDVWVHRKGATRAFPAGHPDLAGTIWETTGHPILIPGSNRDHSFVLRPLPGAKESAYSVNHGAGRRMSRGEAMRQLSQEKVDDQYRRDRILVNLDGKVPLDESGACYKSAREVVRAVEDAGLAKAELSLWPLGSIKGSDERVREKKRERRAIERSRDESRRDARRMKR
jgi:tRNA-splicing ligase RtcB